jgi:hypothetical protein
MGKSFCSKHTRRNARAGVLALVLLAAFAQASVRAEDDDDDKNSIWNLDKRFLDAFAKGIGLVKGGDPRVDYRERSPLVVPPTRNLPPPQSVPKRAAEWPVDPDIKRREDSASRKKLDRRGYDYDEDYETRALRPSELNKPGAKKGSSKAGKSDAERENDEATNLAPSQLGYFGGLFSWSGLGFGSKEEYGSFKKEPARRNLTEPPLGYQTPSPAQPYGIGKSTAPRPTVTPLDPAVGEVAN